MVSHVLHACCTATPQISPWPPCGVRRTTSLLTLVRGRVIFAAALLAGKPAPAEH